MVLYKKALVVAVASCMAYGCSSNDNDNKTSSRPSSSVASSVSSSSEASSSSSSSVDTEKAFLSCVDDVCTVQGNIDEDFVMTSDITYVLDGVVRVGDGNQTLADADAVEAIKASGVTLTIEPGSHIRASDSGALLVTRGSRLVAEGTAQQPITFSSAVDEDFDGEGEWGGVVIQGFAPQYGAGDTGVCYGSGEVCNVAGEGGDEIGFYGGNDPADDSGSLRYVRIAEGGQVAGLDNEINGLTLQGVGHGTQLSYIQVHNNLDDGIEWFGGTANITHAVLTNNDDDDIDFDEGYQGNMQHVLIRKNPNKAVPSGSNDPRGIEANSGAPDQVSDTRAVLANFTILGSDLVVNGKAEPGIRLRGSVNTQIWNSAVSGYNDCVRIDSGVNVFWNFLGACVGEFIDDRTDEENTTLTNAWSRPAGSLAVDGWGALLDPAASLDSAPANIEAVDNGSGFEFEQTAYIGAVDPDTANPDRAWWAGWTIPGSLDELTAPQAADFVSCSDGTCVISGVVDEDYTLVAGVNWVLDGFTQVGNGNQQLADEDAAADVRDTGVTLTIQPGVHVQALSDGVLLVTRGSKLMAEGTRQNPITFSSAADTDFDGEGEWGGVVIQGFAPQYGAGDTGVCYGDGSVCNVAGEGGENIGFYGGNDPADNSGSLRYVRIAEGGLVAGPNNEINGLTLQGVGHGTQLSYIQVHNNLDDGIEWFGGTANLTHAVLTNNDDDDIDFDEGYQGNMQYILIRKHPSKTAPTGSNDPRGVEANSSSPDQVSATEAVIANMTIVGSDLVTGDNSQPGLRLRGEVNTNVWNTAVSGYGDCYRIDSGANVFSNFLGGCVDGFEDDRTGGESITKTNVSELAGSALDFDAAWAVSNGEALLNASPEEITPVDNGSAFDFVETDFIGAVNPDESAEDRDWWSGWTISGSL